jgi:carbon-monoxide dehydrogenase small subunit
MLSRLWRVSRYPGRGVGDCATHPKASLCIPCSIICLHLSRVDTAGARLIDFEAVSAVRTVEARIIQVDGKQVLTIEALAEGGVLLPFQEAFRGHHAVQCGCCTPGMLITAHAFLLEQPAPTAELVRDVISGNICRCKGDIGIVEAILEASRHLREAS